MSWSPVNFHPKEQDLDRILCIDGLSHVLSASWSDHYCLMNVFHSPSQSFSLPEHDVYILGYWHEVFHDHWFAQIYRENSHAHFIILTDLLPNQSSALDRVTWIRLLHWKWYLPRTWPDIDWSQRIYKISSLSNRCTLFRMFITALLLDRSDVLVRWQANFPPELKKDWMLLSPSRHAIRDRLCRSLDRLCHPFNAEAFINDPQQVMSRAVTNPAYSMSMVNCVNETKDVSATSYLGHGPGPYLSEKTWKSLINGNGLIFSGQAGMCRVLESAGFQFDYPWTNCYNDIVDDLDRLEATLEILERILEFDLEDLVMATRPSALHNQEHMKSGRFEHYVDQTNQKGLAHLADALANL